MFTPHISRVKKQCKHSLEAKRRQRLSRNKKRKMARKAAKKGLGVTIDQLQEQSKNMKHTLHAEKTMKEKYFQLWRESENEKSKLKTGRKVFSGKYIPTTLKQTKEILKVDPTFLEETDGQQVLGKGRFGTVVLKKFRSSPVAVKYFDIATSSSMVEREASFLQHCCHINLPIIYGMNSTEKPYFIVTQFYGSQESTTGSQTLKNILEGDAPIKSLNAEQWLHIISQFVSALCHLHRKDILHNDIKNDNILIVNNAGFYSPILVDFGKACLISEAKIKNLTQEEQKRYRNEHCHISPEVVNGTQRPSIRSDVFSVGVVLGKCYHYCKHKAVKEIAKRCLCDFSTRCSSAQLLEIVESFRKLKFDC